MKQIVLQPFRGTGWPRQAGEMDRQEPYEIQGGLVDDKLQMCQPSVPWFWPGRGLIFCGNRRGYG